MSKVRRVDFSPDEWIAGTRELSMEERGAYWDVCALMYSRGGPIADDDAWIARTLGCNPRKWRSLKASLVAVGKLRIEGGQMVNGRAERELKRAQSRLKQARDAAEESAKQRRDRAENAAKSNDYKDIPEATVCADDGAIYQLATSNSLESKKEITPTESVRGDSLAEGSPAPKREPKGTRMPEGWRPEGKLRQWTIDRIAEDHSGVSAGHELEKFQNHWKAAIGAKGRKADWDATWRNWILRAIELEGKGNGRARTGQANSRPANGITPTVADGVSAAFARRSVPHGG